MAALPYMQLYVADYLADTMHLTTEEHGAYLLLILNYWQTGKPIQKSRAYAITKMTKSKWSKIESIVLEYFTEEKIENNIFLFHDRITDELNKVKNKSTKASEAGKASAAKRAEIKKIQDKEDEKKVNERSTSVQQPSERVFNHTDTDTERCPDPDSEADSNTKADLKTHTLPVPKKTETDRVNILKIFDHYRSHHPRAHKKPHAKMKEWSNIKARFKEGSTVEDLKLAIDGCHLSPFHMGTDGQNKTRYDSLELITRSGSYVTKFIEIAEQDPNLANLSAKGRATVQAGLEWLAESKDNAGK